MYPPDVDKTAFMSFGLKNTGVTYQRLMDKVFTNHISRNLEVYVDNMVIKSTSPIEHIKDLEENFAQVRKYDMRLNLDEYVFEVQGGKFLGFMLVHRGIEVNLDKALALLSRFLSRATKKAKPFFQLLKKPTSFHWNDDCEKAFKFKKFLSSPPPYVRFGVRTPPYNGAT
ncbi:Retrovirus-related Pol polyprotein from transposon 17.6, partial [Mucuna pruriens]